MLQDSARILEFSIKFNEIGEFTLVSRTEEVGCYIFFCFGCIKGVEFVPQSESVTQTTTSALAMQFETKFCTFSVFPIKKNR